MKSAEEEDSCHQGVTKLLLLMMLLLMCSDPKGQFCRNHRQRRMIGSWFHSHTENPLDPHHTGSCPRGALADTTAASAPSTLRMKHRHQSARALLDETGTSMHHLAVYSTLRGEHGIWGQAPPQIISNVLQNGLPVVRQQLIQLICRRKITIAASR